MITWICTDAKGVKGIGSAFGKSFREWLITYGVSNAREAWVAKMQMEMSLVPGACENSSSTLVKLKVFFFGMPGDSSQKRTCAPEQLIFYFDDTV